MNGRGSDLSDGIGSQWRDGRGSNNSDERGIQGVIKQVASKVMEEVTIGGIE